MPISMGVQPPREIFYDYRVRSHGAALSSSEWSGGLFMIRRKATNTLAQLFECLFTSRTRIGTSRNAPYQTMLKSSFRDFLYDHEYDAWFFILMKGKTSSFEYGSRLRELIMGIHTGDTIFESTRQWTVVQRQSLCQGLLKKLSEDLIYEFDRL